MVYCYTFVTTYLLYTGYIQDTEYGEYGRT